MPVGGKRPGAGRKPGDAWKSPRPKAARVMAKARVREILATSKDPLTVLIDIANDPAVDVQLKIQAASAAAPFVFPRLSAAVVATAPMSAKDDGASVVEKLMNRIARVGQQRGVTIDHSAEPAVVGGD